MKKIFLFLLILNVLQFCFSQIKPEILWKNLNDKDLPFEALNFVLKAKEKIQPPNDSIISIIDFTKPSTEKRFFIINLNQQKIILKTYVAHGKGSGENYAENFSNKPGTQMSSPGLYLTDKPYFGKHGYSLKLTGLEKGINDNAYSRAIVIHGAWYVSVDFIEKYGRLGRSWGCPAVPKNQVKTIIDIIKNGSLLFIYTKDKHYWSKTKFISH